MIGEIEMVNYEGTCQYCGDIQPILSADQIDADKKVSEQCACDGYKKEQRLIRACEAIDTLFGDRVKEKGLKTADYQAIELMKQTAEAINEDVIKSAVINAGGGESQPEHNRKRKDQSSPN